MGTGQGAGGIRHAGCPWPELRPAPISGPAAGTVAFGKAPTRRPGLGLTQNPARMARALKLWLTRAKAPEPPSPSPCLTDRHRGSKENGRIPKGPLGNFSCPPGGSPSGCGQATAAPGQMPGTGRHLSERPARGAGAAACGCRLARGASLAVRSGRRPGCARVRTGGAGEEWHQRGPRVGARLRTAVCRRGQKSMAMPFFSQSP